ncbi:hypothetical protein AB833_01280 [Chromatiales bacterium (ex Bugula neritina AB1)]|nr:hypothetical protein AB833_01280 [Chromatiales bacterium (ex Bugula neritina AB1)]
MIKGSCLCGNVTFELDRTPELMNICHCPMCRKITGSAYGVFAHIKQEYFHWLSGIELVSSYVSSAENIRAFCKRCGSSVPNTDDGYMCIPAGSLVDDPDITPSFQIFTGSKAPWHDLAPSPKSFLEFNPDD